VSKIPNDVMEEARRVVAQLPYSTTSDPLENRATIIAAALLVAEQRGEEREREACAKVAEAAIRGAKSVLSSGDSFSEAHWNGRLYAAEHIAAGIRARSATPASEPTTDIPPPTSGATSHWSEPPPAATPPEPRMTRAEYIAAWATRSGLSFEWADLGFVDCGHGRVRVALPCACGDENCEGWAMVPADGVLDHLEHRAPESLRRAYIEAIEERQPTGHVTIAHDGFACDVIVHYVTRDGKRDVVVQQDGALVVHVHREKWPTPPADATEQE
jgi:hypothetical protein